MPPSVKIAARADKLVLVWHHGLAPLREHALPNMDFVLADGTRRKAHHANVRAEFNDQHDYMSGGVIVALKAAARANRKLVS